MIWAYAAILAAHLLAANLAALAPFYALFLEWRGSRTGDRLSIELGRVLAWASIVATLAAAVIGISVLFIVIGLHPEKYGAALAKVPGRGEWLGIPERLWSGLAEIVVFLLSMLIAIACWDLWRTRSGARRWLGRAIVRGMLIFAGTNILYHLPVLFAVLAVMSTRPEWLASPPSFVAMMLDGEVAARVLHGWIAAFAVTGMSLLWLPTLFRAARMHDFARVGAWLAAIATGLQWFAGSYLLWQLPDAARFALVGGDPIGTLALAGSLVGTLVLLHLLGMIIAGRTTLAWVASSWITLAAVVILMVYVRHAARAALIGPVL